MTVRKFNTLDLTEKMSIVTTCLPGPVTSASSAAWCRDGPHADPEARAVVEASLKSGSGRLVVMGCTDYEPEAARFEVTPGWLRLRVSRSNLGTAGVLDIDSAKAPETMERVRIQVWPLSSCGCHGR